MRDWRDERDGEEVLSAEFLDTTTWNLNRLRAA